jgi:hypothetical protein
MHQEALFMIATLKTPPSSTVRLAEKCRKQANKALFITIHEET